MAGSDKSITQFPNGTLAEGSLFVAADVASGVGYASGKHSASELGEGLLGDFEYQALQTGNKSVFGAINELNAIGQYVTLSGTLTAGNTSLTISDNRITTDSMFDIYTDVYGVNPTAVTVASGSITLTFEAHQSDLGVKVNLKASHQDSEGIVITGTFTSASSWQTDNTVDVNVGFEPDVVIVRHRMTTDSSSDPNNLCMAMYMKEGTNGSGDKSWWDLRPYSNNSFLIVSAGQVVNANTGIIAVSSTGFTFKTGYTDTQSVQCEYIAIKF